MSLSQRLKDRRVDLGLDVKHVARQCNVSPSAVYAWESGDTKGLKPTNLVCVAEVLKTHEKWLAMGVGPKVRAMRADELSPSESELIEDFRDLSTDEQTGMKSAVFALADQRRKKKRRS
jgi:transcriptional regulator with XRE-family HTH domain